MVNRAIPPLRFAVPRTVEPSTKATLPEGVGNPPSKGLTMAMSVTPWPMTALDVLTLREDVVATTTDWPAASVPLLLVNRPLSLV